MEEGEETQDALHQDNLLWGKGIMDVVTRVVAATEQSQREKRKVDTKGISLEASILTDLMQTAGLRKLEECRQLQPGRQLNPKQKPKPNPAQKSTPTLRTTSMTTAVTISVLTPIRQWETVPQQNQKKLASPATVQTTGSSLPDRRQTV